MVVQCHSQRPQSRISATIDSVNRKCLALRQLEIENELRDVVSRIINQVDLSTKQGRLDINLSLEDALIPILKAAYNLPNLINLNRRQKTSPASIWVMTMTVSPFRLPPPLLWKRSKDLDPLRRQAVLQHV